MFDGHSPCPQESSSSSPDTETPRLASPETLGTQTRLSRVSGREGGEMWSGNKTSLARSSVPPATLDLDGASGHNRLRPESPEDPLNFDAGGLGWTDEERCRGLLRGW